MLRYTHTSMRSAGARLWTFLQRSSAANRPWTPSLSHIRRTYATTAPSSLPDTVSPAVSQDAPTPPARRTQAASSPRGPMADREEIEMLMEIAGRTGNRHTVSMKAVEEELKWLPDPKQLADRVARLLSQGRVAMAAAMVRKAQTNGMECMVAWNRLMAYCMDRRVPLAAWKFYNDMKKRGRRPSEHTYTIMIKGFAHETKQRWVKPVEKAYSIWKSISAPNSVVTPNIIHHNAMLEVCGRHHDLDTLWKVISELPESGPDAPDTRSYTLILMAIHRAMTRQLQFIPENQARKRQEVRENHLRDAKRIWADVVRQWKVGSFQPDNHLVGTMAEILIDPLDEYSCYEALALFKQTMGIPILLKEPPRRSLQDSASEQGRWEAQHWQRSSNREPRRIAKEHVEEDAVKPEEELDPEDEEELEDLEHVFDPVTSNRDDTKSPYLLKPGNAELNFILAICRLVTQGMGAGQSYWGLLTLKDSEFQIEPDSGNFHEYLRLLRVSRSSRLAATTIREQMVPAGAAEGKTFHIAMSCCLRDRINPNVFLNAQLLLDTMRECLPLPDPRPLNGFLELADVLARNPQWLLSLNGIGDFDLSVSNLPTQGRKLKLALLTRAFSALEPHIQKLYDAMMEERYIKTGSPEVKSPGAPKAAGRSRHGAVNGFLALNFLNRTRTYLDRLLGAEYAGVLSETDRKPLEDWSIKLRYFSKPDVVVKFNDSLLLPTPEEYQQVYGAREEKKNEQDE